VLRSGCRTRGPSRSKSWENWGFYLSRYVFVARQKGTKQTSIFSTWTLMLVAGCCRWSCLPISSMANLKPQACMSLSSMIRLRALHHDASLRSHCLKDYELDGKSAHPGQQGRQECGTITTTAVLCQSPDATRCKTTPLRGELPTTSI
jgi:hypothetical protein